MGKNNTIVKRWLSDKKRSADLFNAEIFGGKQVVHPEHLEMIPTELNTIVKDKAGKEKNVDRYRDIVMRWDHGLDFLILAIENQDKTHYAMPVRNMIYDGLAYKEQIEQIWKEHVERKEKVGDKEFLSKLKKEDRLNPIITIVFYYGEEPWDGKTDIHGLLGLDEIDELDEIRQFIPNYHINLVDAARITDVNNYMTDLQHVPYMIRYKESRRELCRYIEENNEYFNDMEEDAYQMMTMLSNSSELLKQVEHKQQGGKRSMCKALEDLYAEGIEKGIRQGREEGREEGREDTIRDIILKNRSRGKTNEEIAEFLSMPMESLAPIVRNGLLNVIEGRNDDRYKK